jgi:hypothetical protein
VALFPTTDSDDHPSWVPDLGKLDLDSKIDGIFQQNSSLKAGFLVRIDPASQGLMTQGYGYGTPYSPGSYYYPGYGASGAYSSDPYGSYANQVKHISLPFLPPSLSRRVNQSFRTFAHMDPRAKQQMLWSIQRRIELLRSEQVALEYDLRRGPNLKSFRRLRQIERVQAEILRLEAEMIALQRGGGARGYGGYAI